MDTKKAPLSSLKDLADAVRVILKTGFQHNKEPRKELEKILQAEGATKD